MIAEVVAEPPILSNETLVPLGIVVTLLLGFVGGVWKIANTMSTFGHRLDLMEERINNRLTALEVKKDSHVTWSQLRAVLSALHAANPTMKAIDLDEIKAES